MKELFKFTPLDIVTHKDDNIKAMNEYHKKVMSNVQSSGEFEAAIPLVLTPNFIALHGDLDEVVFYRVACAYLRSLIPMVETPDTIVCKDASGAVQVDRRGKPITQEKRDANGKIIMKKVPMFELSKSAYQKIQSTIDARFENLSVFFEARGFAEGTLASIDKQMFDRMNDYLWRHIMAVVHPEDVKREFAHFCITAKRRLYYLGDRNHVHNQTIFGLWQEEGGSGKTTMLEAFSDAFSNGNKLQIGSMEKFFKFNGESAGKYGIGFCDETTAGNTTVKNELKSAVDASSRRVEGKGKDAIFLPNLLGYVFSANHRISSHLFKDEARGQRRDACFQSIGGITQFEPNDMRRWFDTMFQVCPLEDDFKTYTHGNPGGDMPTDDEYTVLDKLYRTIENPLPMKIGQLMELLGIKSKSQEYYALKQVMKLEKFFVVRETHDKSKFYTPNLMAIGSELTKPKNNASSWWNKDWFHTRPWLDVDAVLSKLKDGEYDMESPITYDHLTKAGEVES